MTTPTQHNCEHQAEGWCLKCVGELANERDVCLEKIARLKLHIVALEEYHTRQMESHRLDYEDGLPWQEDER